MLWLAISKTRIWLWTIGKWLSCALLLSSYPIQKYFYRGAKFPDKSGNPYFSINSVVDVVSELPSLTHAQLSEPSIQLTALPVPYTTHNMLTTYPCLTTALASCQAVTLRVVSGRVKKSKVTNLISILTLRPLLDYHYFLAIRSRL